MINLTTELLFFSVVVTVGSNVEGISIDNGGCHARKNKTYPPSEVVFDTDGAECTAWPMEHIK